MAELPYYHKRSLHGKPTPLGRTSSGSFHQRTGTLLIFILAVFATICLTTLYYIPEISHPDDYDKVYRQFIGGPMSKSMKDEEPPLDFHDNVTPPSTVSRTTASSPSVSEKKVEVLTVAPEKEEELTRPTLKTVSESEPPSSHPSQEQKVVPPAPGEYKAGLEGGYLDREKRDKIKEMMKHAWSNYARFAWGDNELNPIAKTGHNAAIFGKVRGGATIVDSLDTLYIMGLMSEFWKAKEWIANSLTLDNVRSDVSVFEINIRFVGGLLSAYALSKDEVFKRKAVEFTDKLLPACNTPSGIPYALINPATGAVKNWNWASGGSSILAEFGSLHLEWQYLSEVTGDPKYLQKVQQIRKVLQEMNKPDGLYPNFLNPKTRNWGTRHISIGALGDSFYEYLLKSWLMTSKKDTVARDMYFEAMKAMVNRLLRTSNDGFKFMADLRNGRQDEKMDHLGCFSGGMFALSSMHAGSEQSHYMDIGAELTRTCHESYARTACHLGPEVMKFPGGRSFVPGSRAQEKVYILRPETVESYFYLWRTTHDQKYRDWAWDMVQGLEKYCRVENGYVGLKDVFQSAPPKDNVQQSFFLAETLKYLYLIFSDDSELPLDQWVFNTEAHPFPVIKGVPFSAV